MAGEGDPILALEGRRTTGQSIRSQNGLNFIIIVFLASKGRRGNLIPFCKIHRLKIPMEYEIYKF